MIEVEHRIGAGITNSREWKRTRQRVKHGGDVGEMNNVLPKRDFRRRE